MDIEQKIEQVHNELGVKTEEVKKEEVKEVQLSADEVKAIESGWKPLEEWEKEGKSKEDWRPAKEYNERGELFERIEAQNKEVKQLRKVLDTLKDHHLKVKQTAMEEAIALLKRQRAHASNEENLTKVLEITDEIDKVKEKYEKEIEVTKTELNAQSPVEPHPDFVAWHKQNKWYKLDEDSKDAMSLYADKIAMKYARENKDWTYDEVFQEVDKALKTEFPERFKAPKQTSQVEGASSTRPSKNTGDKYQLTEAERAIGATLVKSGVMTWEKYVADLKQYDSSHGA